VKRAGITYRYTGKLPPYADALRAVGIEPVPLIAPGPYSLDGLDGLLISGGTDLDPSFYGQQRHAESEDPDTARDAMELELMRAALAADLPLFCICRGMQLFNVSLGGALDQHIPNAEGHRVRGVDDVHEVMIYEGTRLAGIVGKTRFTVNSRHHQAITRLGEGLVVSAVSADGVVEGVELPGRRFALAVQWHPEDRVPSHEEDTRLFAAFGEALYS